MGFRKSHVSVIRRSHFQRNLVIYCILTIIIYIYIYIYMCVCVCVCMCVCISCRSKERIEIYLKQVGPRRDLHFLKFIHFVLTYVLYMCMFPACCFRQRTYVAEGLGNGVLNDLNSLLFALWIFFLSVLGSINYSPFFLVCVYFSILWYLSLCVCVYVCTRVGEVLGFTNSYVSFLRECVSWGFFLCVAVWF